jgi:hypothetical protein
MFTFAVGDLKSHLARRSVVLPSIWHFGRVGILGIGICACLLLAVAGICCAKEKDVTVTTFTPAITLTLEATTPQGTQRIYPTATGPSYWQSGLPVVKGDHVKVDVFVSTGGGELKQVKVRLDNQLIATLDKTPWSTTIDTSTVALGYHNLEVWAQETDSKHQTFATKTMTFFVDSTAPSGSGPGPVAAVKGEQQVLNGSSVTDVTLAGVAKSPALPTALATATQDSRATVSLSTTDPTAQQAIATGNPVPLSAPIVIAVNTPNGSAAHRFIYTLVRGDQTIYQADHPVGAGLARIRLQQRSDTQPGLLPGRVSLWVWGVDDQGNYGNPVSATFDIAAPAGAGA